MVGGLVDSESAEGSEGSEGSEGRRLRRSLSVSPSEGVDSSARRARKAQKARRPRRCTQCVALGRRGFVGSVRVVENEVLGHRIEFGKDSGESTLLEPPEGDDESDAV